MSSITVEVIEDASHPEGGHAIIRLNGLKTKPDADAFIIEHAGQSGGQTAPNGWPAGARTPLKTRLGDAGFDIMVGPDVVENPVLLPGTPVVIKVPAAGVTAQVLWPDIKPLRRQKVKRIITSTDRRNAIARTQSRTSADGRLFTDDKSGVTKDPSANQSPRSAAGAGSIGAGGAGHSASLSTLSPRNKPQTGGTGAPGTAAPASERRTGSIATARDGASGTSGNARSVGATQSPGKKAKLPGEPSTFAPDTRAGGASTKTTSSGQPDWSGGMATGGKGKAGSDKGVVGSTIIHTQQGKSRSFGRAGGFAVLGLVAALIAGGVAYKYEFLDRFYTVQVSNDRQKSQPLLTLYDAFRTQAVSPRGIVAAQTTTASAIERASASLYGADGKRDSVEAAFWLKKYLAKQMSDRQVLWALTQLGSTYAQPVDGAPDYFKARMLWETAAALGDPVAACFLGGLHEFGLGVPAHKGAARKWYLQAKSTGGCRFLDKAIARVAD